MWYRFKKGAKKGILRVKNAQVAWYDMEKGGFCFDESFTMPEEDEMKTLEKIGRILPYVETEEDCNKIDRSRVFINFDNGDVYELVMKKIDKDKIQECGNFFGGK